MALLIVCSIVYIIGCCSLMSETAQTRVELTSPVEPVTVGGILALQCQVWNMKDSYKLNLFRVVNGETEQLTIRGNYDIHSSLGQRAFLSKRTVTGGARVLFFTVVNSEYSDRGKYSCKVYSWTDDTINNVAQDSIIVNIYTFPDKMNPICSSVPNTLTFRIGGRFNMKCSSDKGIPTVDLNWYGLNSNSKLSRSDSTIEGDTLENEIVLNLDSSYDGVIFECKMTSVGFPDRERSCIVGPLRIIQDSGVVHSSRPEIIPLKPHNNELITGELCSSSCPSEDPYTLLYWAAATVGTTILMFIFLTTTVMYCCKYQKLSSEVITPQNSFTSGDGSEPIYVSLQRRHQDDRRSVFMSIEDPNNPGNNVLMPREVVEEFYRSLSLKRKK